MLPCFINERGEVFAAEKLNGVRRVLAGEKHVEIRVLGFADGMLRIRETGEDFA